MKTLILTEKPETAGDMAKGLDVPTETNAGWYESDEYVVTWAFGHLLELCPPEDYDPRYKKWDLAFLPIIPDTFRYRVARHPKQLKIVRELVGRADIDRIVLATDAGREGELIGRLILEHLGVDKPLWRFWMSAAWHPVTIREGFARLRPARDFDPLFRAALARQQADWLVGINASRALTLQANVPGMTHAVGRVKTPTLALIVRRQQEIERFVPKPYWKVKGHFAFATGSFHAGWVASDQPRLPDLSDDLPGSIEIEPAGDPLADEFAANRLVNRLCPPLTAARCLSHGRQFFPAGSAPDDQIGIVADVRLTIRHVPPPALFSLATLQQEASRLYGFDLETTESLAQKLYQKHKIISYPRTDSQVLGEERASVVPTILDALRQSYAIGDLALAVDPGNRRVFDDTRLIEGHHAIIPNGAVPSLLSEAERALYLLIVKRFVSAFCPPNCYITQSVSVTIQGERFLATRTLPRMEGWKAYYTGVAPPEVPSSPFDHLQPGDMVELRSIMLTEQRTQPPPLYTAASLLGDMICAAGGAVGEEIPPTRNCSQGIGSPSARGKLIRELLERNYLVRQGATLVPTRKARTLIEAIGEGPLADPLWTVSWENRLTRMTHADEALPTEFLSAIKEQVHLIVSAARKINESDLDCSSSLGDCPACGGVVREEGDRYACREVSRCRFVIFKDQLKRLGKAQVTPQEMSQLLSGKPLPLAGLEDRKGTTFNSQGKLERQMQHGWRIALCQPGPAQPSEAPAPCHCSSLPSVTPREARPDHFDTKVLALAAGTYLDAHKLLKTRKHMQVMMSALVEGGMPPSREAVDKRLHEHGLLPARRDYEVAPPPFDVLCEAQQEMSGVWILLNSLQARFSPHMQVAIQQGGALVHGEIIESLPDSGHYRILVDDQEGGPAEQLWPWEQVFCPDCGQHGLSASFPR